MTTSTGAMATRKVMRCGILWPELFGAGACVICGCTQEHACADGCSWIVDPREENGQVVQGLCDLCLDRLQTLLETPKADWCGTRAGRLCLYGEANLLYAASLLARGAWRKKVIRAAMKARGIAHA